MKTFRAEIRLKNNRLVTRRLALGLTLKEVARRSRVCVTDLCRMENLRYDPLRANGESWRAPVLRVAEFYDVDPAELFPSQISEVKTTRVVAEFDKEELAVLAPEWISALPSPEDVLLDSEKLGWLQEVWNGDVLTARERDILERRYLKGETLREVGAALDLSVERVRQVENRALRRLRKLHMSGEREASMSQVVGVSRVGDGRWRLVLSCGHDRLESPYRGQALGEGSYVRCESCAEEAVERARKGVEK